MLNRLRSGLSANLLENRLAPEAIGAVHANLDEFVAFQSAVDFHKDGGGQAGSADPHDRVERMRPRLQFAAPGGCQIMHGGSLRNGPH